MGAVNFESKRNTITTAAFLPEDGVLRNLTHAVRLHDIVGPGHGHEAVMIRGKLGYSKNGETGVRHELRERQHRIADDNDSLVGAGLLRRRYPDPEEPHQMYAAHKGRLSVDDTHFVFHNKDAGVYDISRFIEEEADGAIVVARFCLRNAYVDPVLPARAVDTVGNLALGAAQSWASTLERHNRLTVRVENHTADVVTSTQLYPRAA